mmetsp:Transcript_4516/g.12333  ORF Transcript_4516/g.12333 Transcript_4516/m.12333 type:complete len:211 (+) Transcript_4516:1329-1961(+)
MPNSFTSLRFVDTATMCFATASGPSCAMSHLRTVRALSMVSAVVKVLDTTTTSVSSGFMSFRARATSIGSTFARKRRVRPSDSMAAIGSVLSAVCTNRGPRKEPPMPIATTFFRGLPVTPFHSPLRTLLLKSLIFSSTSHTSGTTSRPSTMMLWSRRARVATCKAALSSVLFMCSPANMDSIFSRSWAFSASLSSSSRVLAVTRCRDKSQ